MRDAAIEGIAGGDGRLGVHRQQRAIVIEHLFEMRNHPEPIHGIAAETAAQLIVQSTLAHAPQRQGRHVQGMQIRRVAGAGGMPVPQRPFQRQRMGKFRRAAEAAVFAVETRGQIAARGGERRRVQFLIRPDGRRHQFIQHPHQRLTLGAQLIAVVPVEFQDAIEHLREGRHAVTLLARKVGAAEEGPLVIVAQEHGQRPAAAALGQQLLRDLVDAVHVRSFFPVHLDVDEILIEQARRGFILEALIGHDVAPVTGRIAHRQVHRPAAVAGRGKSLRSPGIPVHGVVGVLAQVGAGLLDEPIGVAGRAVGVQMADSRHAAKDTPGHPV